MSCAAPGVLARGDLRRELLRDQRVSACQAGRPPKECPSHPGIWFYFVSPGHRSNYWCSFTLQLSSFGVERGRLGEVVSLVGDCRPPPPGNPRRPAGIMLSGQVPGKPINIPGGSCFTPKSSQNGETESSNSRSSTLYTRQHRHNLKELNNIQYFKKIRSSFYCTRTNPVLEFERYHSHLCGSLEVKPPSIAITHVLETGYIYAMSLLPT